MTRLWVMATVQPSFDMGDADFGQGAPMTQRTKLPLMVWGRRMMGDAPAEVDPKITFEIEAETGETFEVSFSLRGILTPVVMAYNWPPLKEALAQIEPPLKV